MSLKTAIFILIAVLIVCSLAIYYTWQATQKIEIEKPSFPSWIEVVGAGDILNLEITPYEEPTSLYRKWRYLRDYLNEKLAEKAGLKVNLKIARDYRSAINDVGLGVADLAILPPVAYLEARRDYCVQPLATPLLKEGNRCLLVARKDRGINTIADIRGKSFAYADEKSLCGSLIPHKWMRENNIVYQTDLKTVKYFPHYNAVLEALTSGEFDVAGVKEATFKELTPPDLKIVTISEPLPDLLLVGTFDIEKGLIEQIVKALSEMDSETLKKLNPDYLGWQTVTDENYDSLRTMVQEIHGLNYFLPTPDFCAIKPKCKLAPKK